MSAPQRTTGRVLVVDNYDSFVYNLVQYLGQLGVEALVLRNDDPALTDEHGEFTSASLRRAIAGFDGVLLSPGPGTPQRAGATIPLVHLAAADEVPLLGVCLGHQAIGAAFGGTVARAPELLHGKTSLVFHDDAGVLRGLPDPFTATRYHSLTVAADTIPDELAVIGRTDTGIVMAVAHRELPIHGVQFHPESVLTQGGHRMLANWLAVAGVEVSAALVDELEADAAAAIG
ncbi:MAG: aminodeoxychorismate/anthranilate synthase component II [Gordonia sp. (in: high G+C Gram-positive bacteria)]